MLNSKNYVPKNVFQKGNYNEQYKENNTNKYEFISNDINNKKYNKYISRNYLSNENVLFNLKNGNSLIHNNPPCIKNDEEKNISNGCCKLFGKNKNYPIFIPSKYKKKENKNSLTSLNHSEKTESCCFHGY